MESHQTLDTPLAGGCMLLPGLLSNMMAESAGAAATPLRAEGFAWQRIVARRLAERGVRFIELIDGGASLEKNWDTHAKMANYNKLARNVDRPIAALLKDLKSRGMLEDTIVAWTTEFGRTPFCPAPNVEGRGRHAKVYSSWLAGGGIAGGVVYGASDEIGRPRMSCRCMTTRLRSSINWASITRN